MYVSEVNHYQTKNLNFGAKTFNVIKQVRSKEAVVQLQGEIPSRVVSMVNGINKVHDSLRKLIVQKGNQQAQDCLDVLRAKHGFVDVLETPTDGIIFAGNDGKNLIVSSHGVNSLRLREQNAKTGEIESSIFIHDRKLVKNDTKHEIPKKIEYLKHEDIGYQFGDELQTKLDDADFALVKVRRALSAPEFKTEIAKVEPAQILPVNIKPKAAPVEVAQKPVVEQKAAPVEVVEKPAVEQPVAAVKPVKKVMDTKRIELVNSLLSDDKTKKVADEVVEAAHVKRRGRPKGSVNKVKKPLPSNKLIDLILKDCGQGKVADEVVEAVPVKRRGRPKGSVNEVKKEKPVVPTAPKPQTEKPVPKEKVKVQEIKKPIVLNVLSDEEMSLVGEVKSEFKRVYETLNSGSVSKNTRTSVKNGYGEKLLKDTTCSKVLNFVGIGSEGSNVGINVFERKNGDFLHLRLTDKNNNVKNVIVEPNGNVTKSSFEVNVKPSADEKNRAYTRQELDELEFVPTLQRLKGELGEYNTYIGSRLEKAEKQRSIREEGIKRNAEVKQELNPQQMIKFIQASINQVRIELDKSLRLMAAEITSAASKSFRTFGETANSKLNELQENLMKLVDKT